VTQIPEAMPRRSTRVAGAVLVILAAAIGLEATTFNVAFVTDAIGPKALPMLVALILGIAALRMLIVPDSDVSWPAQGPALRIVGAGVAFILYAGLLPWIGFFTCTTAVVSILSLLYDGPPRKSLLAAAALSGILWLLFVVLLGLALPIGELWMR